MSKNIKDKLQKVELPLFENFDAEAYKKSVENTNGKVNESAHVQMEHYSSLVDNVSELREIYGEKAINKTGIMTALEKINKLILVGKKENEPQEEEEDESQEAQGAQAQGAQGAQAQGAQGAQAQRMPQPAQAQGAQGMSQPAPGGAQFAQPAPGAQAQPGTAEDEGALDELRESMIPTFKQFIKK